MVSDVNPSLVLYLYHQHPDQTGKMELPFILLPVGSIFELFYVDTPYFVNIICTSMAMILRELLLPSTKCAGKYVSFPCDAQ